MVGEDQDDPAIKIFKEDLVAADRLPEFGMVNDQMGTLGAADQPGLGAKLLIDKIDPWPPGIDDDLRLNVEFFPADLVFQQDLVCLRILQL